MVDDQVLLPDRREAVAGMIADALGEARIVGHEFEVGPVDRHELVELAQRQHAVDQEHLVVGDRERALHGLAQLDRHGGLDLEADDRAAAAPLEHALELADQVLGLFLDFDLGVADDPEGALPFDRVAGKEARNEQAGRLLERDQAHRAALRRRRQADEALDLLRHADQRVHRLAVALARQLQRDREAEIGDERERVRRIDRERREHREDVAQEIVLEPGAVGLLEACRPRPARCSAPRAPRAARASAPADRSPGSRPPRRCASSCSDGVSPSGLLVGDAGAHLALEAGDADHEEFVEVVGRDRQEAHPLEQRMGGVLGLLQDAPVEMQPGQLAVDEAIRDIPTGRKATGGRGPCGGLVEGARSAFNSTGETTACARSLMQNSCPFRAFLPAKMTSL